MTPEQIHKRLVRNEGITEGVAKGLGILNQQDRALDKRMAELDQTLQSMQLLLNNMVTAFNALDERVRALEDRFS